MTENTRRTAGVRAGRRGTQVVQGVRAAVVAEMMRVGFTGITIDSVARAAGVNRTTIYRRWPTKAALLGAVVEPMLARYDTDPGTGTLRGDLLALLLAIRDSAALPEGRAFAEAATANAAELRDLLDMAKARAIAPFRRAAEQAVARGEITDRAYAETAAFLAYSGALMWQQANGSPPSDTDCARMIDIILTGATGPD